MRRFDDCVDIRKPEVEIEFRKRQQDRIAPVLLHFQKVFFGVLRVIHSVVAHHSMFSHNSLLIRFLFLHYKSARKVYSRAFRKKRLYQTSD